MVKTVGAAAWAMLLSITVAAAQTGSLRALLVEYRCPVVDRLDRIYEHASPHDYLDRFLVVTLSGHPHGYVQCMFTAQRSKILCEASSGYFYNKAGEPRTFYLPPGAITALGRLGFSTDDSAGNFRYEAGIGRPPDLNAIADLILAALHDGYGARADSRLSYNAPFAPRATTKCIPVS
jgi:T3SS (YopN, CesT) and YbjN peptide-binding chaperone 3